MRKNKPKYEFHELKESESDAVTYDVNTGNIVMWHVYSDVCSDWFTIPLETVESVYPNKIVAAKAEIDEMLSLNSYHESYIDHQIDCDRDDALTKEGA